MKKYLAIATVASTLAFSSIPLNSTLAASNGNIALSITENANYQAENIKTTETNTNRISSLIHENQEHVADYNKESGIITVTITDLYTNTIVSTNVIDTKAVNLDQGSSLPINEYQNSIKLPLDGIGISPLASATLLQSEKTFTNYEYFKYSNKTWEIRRPQPKTLNSYYYKNVNELTGTNSELLPTFKGHVERINSLEAAVIRQIGAGAIGIAISAFVPGGVIATGLALSAMGYSAKSYPTLFDLVNEMEDAYATYMSIK